MPFVIPGQRNFQTENFAAFTNSLLQRRAEVRAQNRASSSGSAGIGAGIGLAAGIVLAPFTGGASLALIPALTAAGGAIGSAVDPPGGPQGAAEANRQVGLVNAVAPIAGGLTNVVSGTKGSGGGFIKGARLASGQSDGSTAIQAAARLRQKKIQEQQSADHVKAFRKNPEDFQVSAEEKTRLEGFKRNKRAIIEDENLSDNDRSEALFRVNTRENRFIGTLRRSPAPTAQQTLDSSIVDLGGGRSALFQDGKFSEIPGEKASLGLFKDIEASVRKSQNAKVLKVEEIQDPAQREAARDVLESELFDETLRRMSLVRNAVGVSSPQSKQSGTPGSPNQPATAEQTFQQMEQAKAEHDAKTPTGKIQDVRRLVEKFGDDPAAWPLQVRARVREDAKERQRDMAETINSGTKLSEAEKRSIREDAKLIKRLKDKGLFKLLRSERVAGNDAANAAAMLAAQRGGSPGGLTP